MSSPHIQDKNDLAAICDDSTTHVTIETPEGWKCERPNCPTDFLHEHTTYPSLASAALNNEPKSDAKL